MAESILQEHGMNIFKDELDYKIKVMTAARDGKTIQCKRIDETNDGYRDSLDNKWNWIDFVYRIKPDAVELPKIPMEVNVKWINTQELAETVNMLISYLKAKGF